MTRIVCAEDCGNSPRRLLLKKVLTALAKGESAFALKNMTEDVVWIRPGEKAVSGKDAVGKLLEQRKREAKAVLVIDNIITHGPSGATNGAITLANGRSYAFSHVYRFNAAADARIKLLTEYLIEQ